VTRLLILVEGQSEEIFVNRTLRPYLEERGVYVQPPIVLWTRRSPAGGGFRGGVSNWNQICKSLLPLLRDTDAWVTTLLDFYGLPDDVPGCLNARVPGDPRTLVAALQDEISAAMRHPRFIPFLALHEFEAWVFCNADVVAAHFDQAALAGKVQQAVAQAGEPELINQGEGTHPKARLKTMVSAYKETSDGPTILGKIGVPAIQAACPHFAGWLARLEALAGAA
jgi:Domain of unknown function (DUF4276)